MATPTSGGKRLQKTLQLRERRSDAPARHEGETIPWLVELVRWIAESARVLAWIAGAALVALLLVGLRRWMGVRGGPEPFRAPPLPTHVQSLDIRPESLPGQIGAAAARLWQGGAHIPALSLLYRGALSRLVHGHGIAIHPAATEGECLALARQRLAPPAGAFFAALVGVWQRAVYAARLPDGAEVLALCRRFDEHLPQPRGSAT